MQNEYGMTSLDPFVERRASARLKETPLRRRGGRTRPVRFSGSTPDFPDRRRRAGVPFDMAATLELNLDRYPTKPAMLTFLQTLLYNAEAGDLGASYLPAYVKALRQAVETVSQSPSPIDAAATLHGYQVFMTRQNRNDDAIQE